MAGPLPRGGGHAGAPRRAAGEGRAPGDPVGDARRQKVVNDEQILTALSTRFRLKIAELDKADPTAKERVPELVARRYQIVPLRATDSYLKSPPRNRSI